MISMFSKIYNYLVLYQFEHALLLNLNSNVYPVSTLLKTNLGFLLPELFI